MRIESQVAVVTGAGSGLGAGTVRMLARAGCRVAALDLQPQGIQALAAEFADAVLPIEIDVCDGPQMEAAFERAAARWGEARILVNCAGVLGVGTLLKRNGSPRELDAFRRVIDINLIGTFNAIRVFAARLHAQPPLEGGERGVIVNTASIAAYEALSGQAAYGSSKGAVAGMTLPLARELARYGIRAMSIAPGSFATAMFAVVPQHTQRTLLDDVPFPPRAGTPEEYAQLVRAIVENPMLNGEVIRIDGAVRMREPVDDSASRSAS
jgi:3-hydroxyacyl-CoA dehydrogenase / 3-hydroxy-2-methylbutyryl-CoA dehydrogenase